VDTARAAEIQVVLEGIPLPASRDELVRYARAEDERAASALAKIPDRTYTRLDAVGEELVRVQPEPAEDAPEPAVESDLPPGGDDYVNTKPRSGAVRRDAPKDSQAQKTLEKQSQTLARQQKKQSG
jgi:hypothetical protein